MQAQQELKDPPVAPAKAWDSLRLSTHWVLSAQGARCTLQAQQLLPIEFQFILRQRQPSDIDPCLCLIPITHLLMPHACHAKNRVVHDGAVRRKTELIFYSIFPVYIRYVADLAVP